MTAIERHKVHHVLQEEVVLQSRRVPARYERRVVALGAVEGAPLRGSNFQGPRHGLQARATVGVSAGQGPGVVVEVSAVGALKVRLHPPQHCLGRQVRLLQLEHLQLLQS